MVNRWGTVVGPSNDKGPHKLVRVKSDGHEATIEIIEPFGVQSNPIQGSKVLVMQLDGDEGKLVGIVMAPPARRMDKQKAGETSFASPHTANYMKHDADGNTKVVTTAELKEKVGADKRTNTEGIYYINCDA